MTPPSHQALRDAYLSAITFDEYGNIKGIDAEQWAVAQHLRSTLGGEIPEAVCRLASLSGRSAWLYEGIVLLLGGGANQILACDIAETVLPILDLYQPQDPYPRHTLHLARAFARGELFTYAGNPLHSHDLSRVPPAIVKAVEAVREAAGYNGLLTASLAAQAAELALYEAAGRREEARNAAREAHFALVARYIRAGGAL